MPQADARRRRPGAQPQRRGGKIYRLATSDDAGLKRPKRPRSPEPKNRIRKVGKVGKQAIPDISLLASQLERADDLLARGCRKIERLRAVALRPSASRLSQQVLENFEAVLTLQIAHCRYLMARLREAKRAAQRSRHTRRPAKKAVVGDARLRRNMNKTDHAGG